MLSAGAIVGIVFGALGFIGIIVGVSICCRRYQVRKRMLYASSSTPTTNAIPVARVYAPQPQIAIAIPVGQPIGGQQFMGQQYPQQYPTGQQYPTQQWQQPYPTGQQYQQYPTGQQQQQYSIPQQQPQYSMNQTGFSQPYAPTYMQQQQQQQPDSTSIQNDYPSQTPYGSTAPPPYNTNPEGSAPPM